MKKRQFMLPPATVMGLPSCMIDECGQYLSVWLEMSDRALVSVTLQLEDLVAQGRVIEEGASHGSNA